MHGICDASYWKLKPKPWGLSYGIPKKVVVIYARDIIFDHCFLNSPVLRTHISLLLAGHMGFTHANISKR